MKLAIVVLLALLGLLQYELWFSPGGLRSVNQLKGLVRQQTQNNLVAKEKNSALLADINDLKKGGEAIEERARNTLGMVRKGETFYQVVLPKKLSNSAVK